MNIDIFSDLTLREGDRVLATPCIELVAFAKGSPTDVGIGFNHAMRVFLKSYGQSLRYGRTGDKKSFPAITRKLLEEPLKWFSDGKIISRKMLSFFAHSGLSARSFQTPALQLTLWGFDDPPFYILRMALPIETRKDPNSLINFVKTVLAKFPLESGYCGMSLFYHPATDEAKVSAWAGPLLLRHPGLGYGDPIPYSNATPSGVTVINWLTLLGPEISKDLGGLKGIQKVAHPGISVHSLGDAGAIIQSGAVPDIGDLKKGETLPAYHAAGRLVASRRASDEAFKSITILGIDIPKSREWLLRFFK